MDILKQTRRHDVVFCRDGIIRISANIAKILDIQPGDCINIDADRGEYLLYIYHRASVVHPELAQYPAACHKAKANCRNMVTRCKTLANAILDIAGVQDFKAGFYCGEPVDKDQHRYLPIITRNPLAL